MAHHGLTEQILPGYDFVNNTELVYDSSKKDEYYHGTHVAGIIAQNAPKAQILPLKVFNNGSANSSDIVQAIEYAETQGALIVNMSFDSTSIRNDSQPNLVIKEAIEDSNMLFVCAAGNARLCIDDYQVYPICYDLDNIISVTSINEDSGLSYFSNYSSNYVDIAAVGKNINSTWPENEYHSLSGTSQAAAQVSAGAAIAASLGSSNIKDTILSHADRISSLQGLVDGARRFNLENIKNNIVNEEIQYVQYYDDFNS